MMEQQSRQCNNCGYPVTYCIIDDAHDPETVCQFVATVLSGNLAGSSAVVDYCPKCGQKLSLKTTRPEPKKIKNPGK